MRSHIESHIELHIESHSNRSVNHILEALMPNVDLDFPKLICLNQPVFADLALIEMKMSTNRKM